MQNNWKLNLVTHEVSTGLYHITIITIFSISVSEFSYYNTESRIPQN